MDDFQSRVEIWLAAAFSEEYRKSKTERNSRFLEESLEVVQSLGCTKEECHRLVEAVYSKPVGEPNQEVGGALITLAALCIANQITMHEVAEFELHRIWQYIDQIREKQKLKFRQIPLEV